MKRSIFLLLLLICGLAITVRWFASFAVAPDSVAVITREGKVTRIEQPGLRWHVPLVENVSFIPVARQYRQLATIDASLADGSICHITVVLLFRTSDPKRAYEWRRQHALDLSAEGVRDDGKDYTEASLALKKAAVSALKVIAPEKAKGGAVSAWLNGYRPPIHADGTEILSVNPSSISCEKLAHPRQPPKPRPATWSELKPFAHKLARHSPSGSNALRFIVPKGELIARDGRLAFEFLSVQYIVINSAKFASVFGSGPVAHRYAQTRIEQLLTSELRKTIGTLGTGAIADFDPLSLAAQATEATKALDELGLRITDIGGEKAGYRLRLQ